MSSSSSSFPSTLVSADTKPQVVRRCADFKPSYWGDRFLEYNSDKMAMDVSSQKVEELKEEVRQILIDHATEPFSQMINLIDTLQRLGVAYHFEKEIETVIQKMFNDNTSYDTEDLYTVALHFRLLRQQGYSVSCDVFDKYKENDGNFTTNLTKDVLGMLSLYEATHLRIHGEKTLDEALVFSTCHLSGMVNHLGSPLAEQISRSLRQPLHKSMPRLEARHFISVYEEDEKHDKQLLQLAKLDFNLLQSSHLKELSQLSKWWKGLDFASKLPFARDRLVELYFWSLGVYFEPHFCLARVILTKVFAITSIIDDIYDVYGTIEELIPFTTAIERWDIDGIDQLPEYMKVVYVALLSIYNEIDEEMAKEGRRDFVQYAKELMKDVAKAYLIEAKWFYHGYIPTIEEYMHNALISSGSPMLILTSFLGMGHGVSKEVFNWVNNNVIPVKAPAVIGRLLDDIESHEFEQKRGHVASAVECYMKQYNVSEQEACDEFKTMVDCAWKDINERCLKPTIVPMPLLLRPLNLSRTTNIIYLFGDGYTHPHLVLKDYITSLFIDPILM